MAKEASAEAPKPPRPATSVGTPKTDRRRMSGPDEAAPAIRALLAEEPELPLAELPMDSGTQTPARSPPKSRIRARLSSRIVAPTEGISPRAAPCTRSRQRPGSPSTGSSRPDQGSGHSNAPSARRAGGRAAVSAHGQKRSPAAAVPASRSATFGEDCKQRLASSWPSRALKNRESSEAGKRRNPLEMSMAAMPFQRWISPRVPAVAVNETAQLLAASPETS